MVYSTWNETCEAIFKMDKEILNKYLQLYPFSQLDNSEKEYIRSEYFFDLFIKKGFIFSLDSTYCIAERFIQKGNGSFRKTYLVSPVLYLYLLAIGKQIESITLFAFFVELKEKKQSRWLFQSQICRIWAS